MATLIERDPKASFSIAATPRCRGGCYSFPWIASLYPWSLPYNAECYARRHQVPFFESLTWLDLGLNPGLLDHGWTLSSSSSSSICVLSTDIPDPLRQFFPIIHCFRQICKLKSHINTDLLFVGFSWSSCLCSSMWRGPQEYITYELVSTSPVVSRMCGSSNFDSFRDRW